MKHRNCNQVKVIDGKANVVHVFLDNTCAATFYVGPSTKSVREYADRFAVQLSAEVPEE